MAQSQRENRNEQRPGWRSDEDRGSRDDGRRRFGTERDDDRSERFERFERFGPASGHEWSESRFRSEPHERSRSDPWQSGWQGSPGYPAPPGAPHSSPYGPGYSPGYGPSYGPSYGSSYGPPYGPTFGSPYSPPPYAFNGPAGLVSGAFPQGPWGPTGGGWYPPGPFGAQGWEQAHVGRMRSGPDLDEEGMPPTRSLGGRREPGRDRAGLGLREHGHRGRGPRGYTRSDERIREDVCDVLTDHPMVDASDVEVAVKSGEVTLSGSVSSRAEKRLAEDIIENLSGVRDVNNQLRVHRWPRQEEASGDTDNGGARGPSPGIR